jgi:hypothetical protein
MLDDDVMKKIALIMGRGIEGCGVTKFTIEQCKFYEKHGYSYKVFASKDKKWTRTNAHNTDNIHQLKFAKDDEVNEMINEINWNGFDMVIINSLPAMSLKEEAIENFKRMLEEIKIPVILIQHDHAMQSIRRNGALDEAIKKASVIFVHSTTNDFAKYASDLVGPKVDLFETIEGTPIHSFQPGMYFDEVKERYWKSNREGFESFVPECVDTNHHKWIGRTTSWKGYIEMFKFHNEYLMPNDVLTTFEGIERSPAFLGFRELSEFNNLLAENIEEYNFDEGYGDHVHVFGPYIQNEMLERMSKAGFGYQLSRMKPHFIDRSIEYTHCEVVCTGTIPVFHKRYGEACTHRHYGEKLIDMGNSGTIWLDENNLEETFAQVLDLFDHPEKRNRMRNQAYEFYKLHQDADYTFKELMNNIEKEI